MKTAQELIFFEPYSVWYYPWWHSPVFYGILYTCCAALCSALLFFTIKKLLDWYRSSYWHRARKQLAKMQELHLADKVVIKDMYCQLTVLMKEYLSYRYKKNYTALTDQEVVVALEYEQITPAQKDQLIGLFYGNDPIKFANKHVLLSQAKHDIKRAFDFVVETKP